MAQELSPFEGPPPAGLLLLRSSDFLPASSLGLHETLTGHLESKQDHKQAQSLTEIPA
jgi:hypothetical protein